MSIKQETTNNFHLQKDVGGVQKSQETVSIMSQCSPGNAILNVRFFHANKRPVSLPQRLHLRNEVDIHRLPENLLPESLVSSDMPIAAPLITSTTDISHATPPTACGPKPEKLILRTASSFFMFFTCGWGDGGKCLLFLS